jgi:hypothetical protein
VSESDRHSIYWALSSSEGEYVSASTVTSMRSIDISDTVPQKANLLVPTSDLLVLCEGSPRPMSREGSVWRDPEKQIHSLASSQSVCL